ncbi:uncharacterized protein [Pocillopora verrucosa]|uniref:uncharacterized protein n=1 Tax=Pocillopora verrucosa TaxID=203993 RepID=UPI003340C517
MAATHRAPKQWCLSKVESINSFENWKQNLIYTLSLDSNFAPFLADGFTWLKKTRGQPLRGLHNDGESVPLARRLTARQKVNFLELMLGQIANYCPIISRNTLVKNSTSLEFIWQTIRQHFGFQVTGAQFIDFSEIHLAADERPEDLYQRLTAFVEDSLLRANGLTHNGQAVQEDEELTPTLENFLVLTWLRLIHPSLPRLVKQRYGTELRSRTLASIKPEISQALNSLLEEIRTSDDARILRAAVADDFRRPRQSNRGVPRARPRQPRQDKVCPLCKQAGRSMTNHFLSQCTFLPDSDRRFMVKARQIAGILDNDQETETSPDSDSPDPDTTLPGPDMVAYRVQTRQSPYMDVFHDHRVVRVTLDSGATGNMIRLYTYGSKSPPNPHATARRAFVLRAPAPSQTVWPGEFMEVRLPDDTPSDSEYALEPRIDAPSAHNLKPSQLWPQPGVVSSVARAIRIPNLSSVPRTLKRHEHFCQVIPVFEPPEVPSSPPPTAQRPLPPSSTRYSASVQVDPDNTLPQTVRADFQSLLTEYDTVFDPQFPGYNGAAGAYKAKVNMGPVEPPQRKGRLPQYARDKLIELQEKFDDLENLGVFRRPEDVGITIEYLNPSFLVKKPNGGSRLVTAFSDVGRYSKPQPSLLPDVDSTLRLIAQWSHIIVTDLTSAFYQISLAKESMKYCGVATPFKGVRVYARSAMGMPGSETALEEVMCRVLGPLLQDGVVAKIADDLYCGGNTPLELLHNWKRVLQALHKCNLRLSAHKTIINPKSTTILGWIWSAGTLSASAHRLNTLATYPVPNTVGRLRSFIGAYKVLSRVIPRCSSYLTPLDAVTAGRTSQESITWSDSLRAAFHNAQKALSSALSITLPRPEDQLWVVTDGAVKDPGIGATLYVTRNNKLHIAGFFSARLRGTQTTWLPCEVEALSIAAATKHFSPYLIQSSNKACILTDSKPCVQAYEKLCRGEFSASPRVSTFLSVVSRYQASVRHVSGASILQSDFASRNAAPCENETCQICLFIASTRDSVVRAATVQDILQGNARLPFTSRPAWLAIQSECPDLRRTHAHLVQGTRPSKKLTNIKDVKRYLQVASIASDGLLVVQRHDPLSPTRECIIVPRQALDGLLTALHIQLSHPSCHQLKMVAKRYLFALDLDKAVSRVSDGCHSCAAIQRSPTARIDQSTSPPPETIGQSFAADVIKRSRQLIFVLRETVTSYTSSLFLENERHQTLLDAIIKLCVEMRPMDGPPAVIRTDPAPGFKALVNDSLLQKHRITIELGHAKNPNKNPVAERAVQELENELLRQEPLGSSVSPLTLAVATSALNSRIRSRGLSSREMWTQRDQFSNKQLPLADDHIISLQHEQRLSNHPLSERSKAPGQSRRPTPLIDIGDLVYLHSDLNKSRARDRYLVVAIDPPFCNIKKFIGSQLRSSSYHVKLSECFKVPSDLGDPFRASPTLRKHYSDSDDEDGPTTTTHPPPSLPAIPEAIAASTHPPVVNPQSYSPAPASPVDHTMNDFATQSPCPDPSPVEYAATSAVPSPPALRRSSRTRRPPSRFADYDTEL